MSQSFPKQLLAVDRGLGVPVSTQLAWRLRRLIATGRLRPGERLPGIRELATAGGVNVNTARAVYSRLADQGYINSEHGRGTFVAEPAGSEELEAVERLASEVEAGARAAGVDPRDVAAYLYAPRRPGAERMAAGGTASDAAARRSLRDQIAELEAKLARHPTLPQDREEGPAHAPQSTGSALLTAADLQEIRDDLRRRLARAESTKAEILRELRSLDAAESEGRPEPRRARSASSSLGGVRVRWTGSA